MTLAEWCRRWNIPPEAQRELRDVMGAYEQPKESGGLSESGVQSEVRLAAAQAGKCLWRNNVGVLKDQNGRPVRYGLANDSSKVNKNIKSADLIGIEPVLIAPEMVGQTIGRFLSLEVKEAGWQFRGTPRENAQLRWAEIVTAHGGRAKFISNKDQL